MITPEQAQTAVLAWIGFGVAVIAALIGAAGTVYNLWKNSLMAKDIEQAKELSATRYSTNTARIDKQGDTINTLLINTPPPGTLPQTTVINQPNAQVTETSAMPTGDTTTPNP